MKFILLLLISSKVFSAYPANLSQHKTPLHTGWESESSVNDFNAEVKIKNELLSEKGDFDLEAIKEAQRKLDNMSDKEIKKSLTMPTEINKENTLKSTKKIRSQVDDIKTVEQVKSIKKLEGKEDIDGADISAVRQESLDKIFKSERGLSKEQKSEIEKARRKIIDDIYKGR